jgi:DNA-directed RNA polymerase specialized sigma24 family protein
MFIDTTQADASPALVSREPTPEFAAEFADVCEMFMQSLGDPQLQLVATLRMEGYTDAEIGQRLGCSRSTVQRRLEIIRRSGLRLTESSDK